VIVAVVLVVRRIVEDGWLDPMGSARFVCGGWTRVFCVFFFLDGVFLSFFSFGSLFHGCHGVGICKPSVIIFLGV
jgi:hypothetical protein